MLVLPLCILYFLTILKSMTTFYNSIFFISSWVEKLHFLLLFLLSASRTGESNSVPSSVISCYACETLTCSNVLTTRLQRNDWEKKVSSLHMHTKLNYMPTKVSNKKNIAFLRNNTGMLYFRMHMRETCIYSHMETCAVSSF